MVPIPLSEVVQDQGIQARIVTPEVVTFAATELPGLLDVLNHTDLRMFDLQPYLEAETVLRHVETVRALDAIRPPQAILSHLEQSGVFVHSHDDCYLYVETREREQAVAHLVNLLKQYATYRLGRTVSSPTFGLALAALEKSLSLVIDEREEARCGSRLPMRLVSEDQGETVLNLDQSTGIWSAAASNV